MRKMRYYNNSIQTHFCVWFVFRSQYRYFRTRYGTKITFI